MVGVLAGVIILFLAFYNLPNYPTTWFDEGSHLHVPKTLITMGVYADYSSDGFRYYGPTLGVGPTVMLPIAAIFRLLGIGLLQARLIIVLYLLAAIWGFYILALQLGGHRFALISGALLIVTPGVALLEYGRQVLGEVPGFFFLVAGLALWFTLWDKSGWRRLSLVGLLFGLSTITKNQYLLVLGPALLLSWLANLAYYRTLPQRFFIIPGLITAGAFALWQVYLILYLGPATAHDNLVMLREATAGAALVFSPALMQRSLKELLSLNVYLGWLIPVLIYGFFLIIPRHRDGQKWSILFVFIAVNLIWFVVASISWIRYAFPGLALSSLFVARFFDDITDGYNLSISSIKMAAYKGQLLPARDTVRWGATIWLAIMIVLPLGQVTRNVVAPSFNAPVAMAKYLDEHVPTDAVIETWEPEMGFLTNHNYHFPPSGLLNKAIAYIWLNGPAPSNDYDFLAGQRPQYVLVGGFARWVNLYPNDVLEKNYKLITRIGDYELYVAQ